MLNNTVIKVLNKKHGQKVKEYFESKGINTICYEFYKESNHPYIYYGVINGHFSNFSYKEVHLRNIKIITLPEEKEYRRVLVSNDQIDWYSRIYLTSLPKNKLHKHLVVSNGDDDNFINDKPYGHSSWIFMQEMPKKVKMTMEEICKELGKEIEIVKSH